MRFGDVHLPGNLLLSPIAGYCDLAFRLTVRPLGGLALASTDLINPRGLLRQTRRSMELVETDPADQPLCIQLYGSEPDEMADAAQWCRENGAAIVDINMGCPVDKVCKTNGGSALLRDPRSALALTGRVVKRAGVPVTVKMRLGWDDAGIVAPDLARALEDIGVAAITIHGRTAEQKFAGSVRLDGIARVVEAVRQIPVIGNGDIKHPEDARRMMDVTGCAGVMIGRAALSDPWIFPRTAAYFETGRVPDAPSVAERIELMHTHFQHLLRIRGERRACITMRQRFSWYARHLGWCPDLREQMRLLSSAGEYYDRMGAFMTTLGPEAFRRQRPSEMATPPVETIER